MKKNTYSALEAYKNLHSYEKVELGWLTGKLTAYEIEELEKQIEYLILEAEEAAFAYAYEATHWAGSVRWAFTPAPMRLGA